MGTELPPSVSGALVRELRLAAEEMLGADLVTSALASVPQETRDDFENALPVGWVPISSVERAFEAIATAAGRGVEDLHVELARESVERTLKTFWRLLLRVTSDAALISRTPVIYSQSYNRGRIVPTIPSPGRGEIALVDWPDAAAWPIRGTRVGVETVLRLAGRRDVRVEGRRTPTGALYVATWS